MSKMGKKSVYILMCKDNEVLSFSVDFQKSKPTFLRKLEYFDKAPYGFEENDEEINNKLYRFLKSRTIPKFRRDYHVLLRATHSRNGFNLSFQGHGLSLSDHYWYKKEGEDLRYEDINFFTNAWDDSFGRAVLNEDFEAISKADLNVPDLVTGGWGVKAWLYDKKKGPRLFKKGIDKDSPEEALGEVLASSLARRLLKEGEALQYDLETINGKYASVSSPMIAIDEELIPLSRVLPSELSALYHGNRFDKSRRRQFFRKLKEAGYDDLYAFFVKLACLRSLCFVNDLHFENISLLRNMDSGTTRMAPVYDLGGSFGSGPGAKKHLIDTNKATLFIILFLYNNLDPEWDYSWYDKDKLIGFGDEMRETLSKSDFYTPDRLDFAVEFYQRQKASLDELSS